MLDRRQRPDPYCDMTESVETGVRVHFLLFEGRWQEMDSDPFFTNSFPGGHRALVPPDPIPNSEVKRCIADDSVGSPHAKVGHRQGLMLKALFLN